MTDDLRATCDRIGEVTATKYDKDEWQYLVPFETNNFSIGETPSKESIFAHLDECLKEIQNFEADLKQKLGL